SSCPQQGLRGGQHPTDLMTHAHGRDSRDEQEHDDAEDGRAPAYCPVTRLSAASAGSLDLTKEPAQEQVQSHSEAGEANDRSGDSRPADRDLGQHPVEVHCPAEREAEEQVDVDEHSEQREENTEYTERNYHLEFTHQGFSGGSASRISSM